MKQHQHREELKKLQSNLNKEQKHLSHLNQEQGASSWLTTTRLTEGYDMTKQLFWDPI